MTKGQCGPIRLFPCFLIEWTCQKKGRKAVATDQEKLMGLMQEVIDTLREENASLRSDREELLTEIKGLREMLAEANAANGGLRQEIANLTESVEYLQRKLFGKASEKTPDPNQLCLFNEVESEADETVPEPDLKEEVIKGEQKKEGNRRSRKAIIANLPVRDVVIPLDPEEQKCDLCGTQMVRTGKKFIREEIQFVPAKVTLIHYYEETWECPKCKAEDDVFETKSSIAPTPLMKHSLASPSTVACLIWKKFVQGVPLCRMESEWEAMGLTLHRSVMANWINYCAMEYLLPMYDRLHQLMLERDILHGDETPCRILRKENPDDPDKAYMWVYSTGDDGGSPIILYDPRPGRKGEYAKEFLKGFSGFLHCDGYSGYNTVEDIDRVGCLSHLRRKYYDAIPAKRKAGDKKLPAEIGVEYCDRIFELERKYRELPPEEKKEKRLETELPILLEMKEWADSLRPAGGSKLEKAVTYTDNQWPTFLNYFRDGRLEATNNKSERCVKSYVIGRKNFLFHDTVKGAKASAVLYSLVETAKANDLDIYKYLYMLLSNMPDYKDEPEGIDDFLPWSDYTKKKCAGPKHKNPEIRFAGN